jgi:hypothetical protein
MQNPVMNKKVMDYINNFSKTVKVKIPSSGSSGSSFSTSNSSD